MAKQEQYPSDYVGEDGKKYPTVGEAFRNGAKILSLIRDYKNLIYDIVTVSIKDENEITYTSKLKLKYMFSATQSAFIQAVNKDILFLIPLKIIPDTPTPCVNLYSSRGVSSNKRLYFSGSAPSKGLYTFLVVIAE